MRPFLKNKVDVIRRSMLKPVREEAGLGSPPDRFYTNASETVNSILKNVVSYKQNELPDFILKVKEVCEEQEREIECAVVRRGKYKFRPQYKHLELSEAKWFSMSRDQRVKHLKKVNSLSVCDVKDPSGVMFVSDLSGPSTSNIDKSAFPSVSSVVESLKPIESSLGLYQLSQLKE